MVKDREKSPSRTLSKADVNFKPMLFDTQNNKRIFPSSSSGHVSRTPHGFKDLFFLFFASRVVKNKVGDEPAHENRSAKDVTQQK